MGCINTKKQEPAQFVVTPRHTMFVKESKVSESCKLHNLQVVGPLMFLKTPRPVQCKVPQYN